MFTSPTSSTGAIMFEIIVLMLVAAIIGFVIAYFFFRNRWDAEKILLEGEVTQYRDQLDQANAEASRFNQGWSECKKRNVVLEPLVKKVEDLTQKQTSLEQELAAKAAENSRLTQDLARAKEELEKCKGKLSSYSDYAEIKTGLEQCETARAELAVALTACQAALTARGGELPPDGAGKETTKAKPKSRKKKLTSAEQLAAVASRKDIIDYESIGRATEGEKQDLKWISGIGPFIEAKLNALDIFTFRQIANFNEKDIEKVTEAIGFFPGRIQRDDWVEQAKSFLEAETQSKNEGTKGKKQKPTREEELTTVIAMKDTIRFDRIGTATEAEKDNLQKIKGIGPFIESKLNALEIYTFRQVANFTDEDKVIVDEAILSFPGRIERDNWVAQAQAFLKEKE